MLRNEIPDQIIDLQVKIDAITKHVETFQEWQVDRLKMDLLAMIDDLKHHITDGLLRECWRAFFKLSKRHTALASRAIYKRPKIRPCDVVDEDPLTLAGIQRR